jgi:hypothetical protein
VGVPPPYDGNGVERSRTESIGVERSRTEWNGVERSRTESNGVERSRTEWNGVERSGTESNGVERSVIPPYIFTLYASPVESYGRAPGSTFFFGLNPDVREIVLSSQKN